jgi:hypothetical protein
VKRSGGAGRTGGEGERTRYADIQEAGSLYACPPGKPRRGTRDVVVYPETARRCTAKTMEVEATGARGLLARCALTLSTGYLRRAAELRDTPAEQQCTWYARADTMRVAMERSGCEELHRAARGHYNTWGHSQRHSHEDSTQFFSSLRCRRGHHEGKSARVLSPFCGRPSPQNLWGTLLHRGYLLARRRRYVAG